MALSATSDSPDVRIARIKDELRKAWKAIRPDWDHIYELFCELHELLAAPGRAGQFSAFLREIDFPRSTAYEWIQRCELARQNAERAIADSNVQPQPDQQDGDAGGQVATEVAKGAQPMTTADTYIKKVAIRLSVAEAKSLRNMLENAAFQTFLGTNNWHQAAFRAVKWAFEQSRTLGAQALSENVGEARNDQAAA